MISCVMLCSWPKRAEFIADALKSYNLQSEPRELVVVNDGEPLVECRGDVTVVNLNSGMTIGEKRNVGLRVASGEWIAPWDDDDISMPNRLSLLLSTAKEKLVDYVGCIRCFVCDKNSNIRCVVSSVAYAAALYNRKRAVAVGGYPNMSYLEDMEFYMRLRVGGALTAYVRDMYYVYRRHADNVTSHVNIDDVSARAIPVPQHVLTAAQVQVDTIRSYGQTRLIRPA